MNAGATDIPHMDRHLDRTRPSPTRPPASRPSPPRPLPRPSLPRPLPPDLLVNGVLFESPLVTVAIFRAGVGHPAFRDADEIPVPLFAFPRNTLRIAVEGEAPYVADPGTVAFYNRGQVFRRGPVDPAGDICDIFAVQQDVLIDLLEDRDARVRDRVDAPFPFTHGPSRSEAYALQRQLLRHVESAASPDRLAVEEGALRLLASIADSAWERLGERRAERPATPTERELAEAVRAHVVARYARTDSLEEIAAATGRSVYHVCRVFRRHVGTSIHQFRHQLRLRRSLDLVVEPAGDLSRTALELGFSSHSHFTAAFRRAFGVTPSSFRRRADPRRLRRLAARIQPDGAGFR